MHYILLSLEKTLQREKERGEGGLACSRSTLLPFKKERKDPFFIYSQRRIGLNILNWFNQTTILDRKMLSRVLHYLFTAYNTFHQPVGTQRKLAWVENGHIWMRVKVCCHSDVCWQPSFKFEEVSFVSQHFFSPWGGGSLSPPVASICLLTLAMVVKLQPVTHEMNL